MIPPELQKSQADDYEIWPEHWPAWQVFGQCQSQWRLSIGMGGAYWQGLDYQGVQIVMQRIVRVPAEDETACWEHLQILEDEARRHLNTPRT